MPRIFIVSIKAFSTNLRRGKPIRSRRSKILEITIYKKNKKRQKNRQIGV
jgi:hypothetical protein